MKRTVLWCSPFLIYSVDYFSVNSRVLRNLKGVLVGVLVFVPASAQEKETSDFPYYLWFNRFPIQQDAN